MLLVYRGRFAYNQRNGAACTWGYGTWQTQGNRGSGASSTAAASLLTDEHQAWGGARLTWSLYRDTLTLGSVDGAISPENYFGQPWRRVSSAPKVDRPFAKCQLPEEGIPR